MTENTQKTIRIHHEGLEGTIEVDALTGMVLTTTDERPEWADGLTCAALQERVGYYFGTEKSAPRLDRSRFEQQIIGAELIDFQDLGWVAVDHEGQAVELEANSEFRMEQTAQLLGIDRTAFNAAATEFEIEVGNDVSRTAEEAGVLKDMQDAIFEPAAEQDKAASL
jgi:hypothetical protein